MVSWKKDKDTQSLVTVTNPYLYRLSNFSSSKVGR